MIIWFYLVLSYVCRIVWLLQALLQSASTMSSAYLVISIHSRPNKNQRSDFSTVICSAYMSLSVISSVYHSYLRNGMECAEAYIITGFKE